MPSPVGHTLAGLCGFVVAQKHVAPYNRSWLFFSSVIIANLPDLDFVPGLVLGDLRVFHHQATHSLAAVVMVGLLVGGLASQWKLKGVRWGIWGGGVYISHVVLDLLVNDPSFPFGVQLLWPLSEAYFISPITPFARFDYYDPAAGILRPLLSAHNLRTIVWEMVLVSPFVGLAWYAGKNRTRRGGER